MSKKRINRSPLTKIFIALLLSALFSGTWLWLQPATIKAQVASDEGTIEVRLEGKDLENVSATPDPDSVSKAINDRINKQLSQEQEKKLNTMLDSINQLRRAIFGQVDRITDDSLTISTAEGTTIVPLPEEVVVKQAGKTIKSTDIAVDSWVLVIGSNTNTENTETMAPTLTPQTITVYTTNPRPKTPMVSLGIIQDLSTSSLTMSDRASDQAVKYTLQKTTIYQDADGTKTTQTKFEKDLTVLIVGVKDDKGSVATIVRSLAPLEQTKQ